MRLTAVLFIVLIGTAVAFAVWTGRSGPDPLLSASGGAFENPLRDAAKEYATYGRIGDSAHWAPTDCRAPEPPAPRFSASDNTATHGQKLYYLFAKDHVAYKSGGKTHAPVGQVLVKQSWVPREVPDEGRIDRFKPYARRDGKLYKAEQQADLFIMMKHDPKTAGTDQGWVYGTVSADGSRVSSAGRVESCMECHVKAPNDRQFGLPTDK